MIKINHLSQILLAAFLCRLLIKGASIGDSLAIIALCGVYGLHMYLEHIKEPEVNKELKEKVAQLEDKVSKQENKLGAIALRR